MRRGVVQGDRVKLTLTFKGREMQFQEIGRELFQACIAPPRQLSTSRFRQAPVLREGVLLSGQHGWCPHAGCITCTHDDWLTPAAAGARAQKFVEEMGEEAMVTQPARMAGNVMTLTLAPNTAAKTK